MSTEWDHITTNLGAAKQSHKAAHLHVVAVAVDDSQVGVVGIVDGGFLHHHLLHGAGNRLHAGVK